MTDERIFDQDDLRGMTPAEIVDEVTALRARLKAAEQEREQTFQSWLRWGLALREVLDLAQRRAHRQIIEKVRNVLGGVEDPSASYAAALAEERARSVRLAELLRGAVCDERCDGGEHMDFCHTVFAALAEHDAARERRLVGG